MSKIENFGVGRVAAFVFCLVTMVFPLSALFAADNVTKAVKQNRIEAVPLLEQVTSLDLGYDLSTISKGERVLTVPYGWYTYVYTNLPSQPDDPLAVSVSVIDSIGQLVFSTVINHIEVVDDNRIDFSVGTNEQDTVDGVLTGTSGVADAVATMTDSAGSTAFFVNFGDALKHSIPSMVPIGLEPGDAHAEFWAAAIVIALLVTAFVGATCLAFGWWGCD